MSTIILQSEEILVIEQEVGASVVETEVNHVLVVEESEINGVIQTEVETILVVESTEAAILIEIETETVIVVEDTEVIVLESIEQGPPGPPGPVGGTTIAGVIDYIWTGTQLDRIDLPDGTHKLFTYAAGKILRLDHVKAAETVRKDYVWAGEVLENINISII